MTNFSPYSSLAEPMVVSNAFISDSSAQYLPPRPWHRSPRFLTGALFTLVALIFLIAFIAVTASGPAPMGSSPLPPDFLFSSSSPAPPPSSPPSSSPVPFAPPRVSLSTAATYNHTSSCFTQGLAWSKGVLYESCGMYGSSVVRTVNLTTGLPIISTALDPKYFAEGLTILNDLVYVLTWQERVVLVYSLDLKLQSTLPHDREGWGVTHNGSALIISDGSSSLYYRDPTTLRLLKRVDVTKASSEGAPTPWTYMNELEWVDGQVMANVWMSTDIVVIEDSGNVVKVLDGSTQQTTAKGDNYNKVMNGVAWNEETKRLYMTGKSPTPPHSPATA